ncbi:hypothetical protein [Robiginitalea aurantiaca]|uniref:Uncharacterized protein n=1 Tax=Robiginitalea aurantiaca TaxID=3056915 RepID=A0ABT7WAS8_9FLAO|nr:hypothetical protein [Robiginitalea aurantiaca]MDM9630014.1 hypothetical protein [Robiginitalea aurantiaca]
MLRNLCLLAGILTLWVCNGQEMPLDYEFGDKYKDRYKYSNLLTFSETVSSDKILVRGYYSGLLVRPKGYLIERYDSELKLLEEYNYKYKDGDFVHGLVANDQIYLLFLEYDSEKQTYQYTVHQSPVGNYNFTVRNLLSLKADYVDQPIEKNYYNRSFKSGFSTTVLSDPDSRVFAISILQSQNKELSHRILVYNNKLEQIMDKDFSSESEEKNYAFEELAVSPDLSSVYLVGKAYFRKRRFKAEERKFQYELLRLHNGGIKTQVFDDVPGKYSEGVKPLWNGNKLICAGFYADRKDNRYNGLQYLVLDPEKLTVLKRKYNPFSEQFMIDKFGQESDKVVKNLVFKGAQFTEDGSLLFNAEEFFMTESMQANASGGRVRIQRFHHNDIISAKLDSEGNLIWARNINKTEVTQGDGAYTSYSSYSKDGQTYFFLCLATEEPQLIGKERLIFKQGYSRSRNVFVIRLDSEGSLSYEKIIDSDEARLPFMVSMPFVDSDSDKLLFYAKQGSRKQLVSIKVR